MRNRCRIQLVGRAIKAELAEVVAEDVVGLREKFCCLRKLLNEIFSHAYKLGTLSWK
ncbi:MAG: hypothetical protein ACO3BO_02895 [Anaerohalosphaeraceae bacterium]